MSHPRILFVDDEPNVLLGVTRALRSRFEIVTAMSGAEGLQQLAAGDIDVVVSDMRMPEMDGATFLTRARALVPDTIRLVMSGHSDLEASVRAINEGSVFRFLVKPVSREQLGDVVAAAVAQRQLVRAERELLEQTLLGAVAALCEGLAMVSPLAFGRSQRLRQLVAALADELHLPKKWTLEVAAMLSQLGAATLPLETLQRWYEGVPLTHDEAAMVERVNALSCKQVSHIPRLEPVLELIAALDGAAPAAAAPLPERVFVVANALERRLARGETLGEALAQLEGDPHYDPMVLDSCRTLGGLLTGGPGVERSVPVSALHPGMVLLDAVYSKTGTMLVARGQVVTDGVVICLRNFSTAIGVVEPLHVLVKDGLHLVR